MDYDKELGLHLPVIIWFEMPPPPLPAPSFHPLHTFIIDAIRIDIYYQLSIILIRVENRPYLVLIGLLWGNFNDFSIKVSFSSIYTLKICRYIKNSRHRETISSIYTGGIIRREVVMEENNLTGNLI